MKPKLLILLFLIACSLSLSAQQPTFNWGDTVFTRGAIHRFKVYWNLDRSGLDSNSIDSLKPIAKFMKENPFIKLEVDDYTSPQGSDKHNMVLSQARAQIIVDYLIYYFKTDSERLVAKGWGFHKPLPGCSATDIAKMTSQQDKEAAWQADRRTEVRIITDSANVFGWNDTKFMYGSKRALKILFNLDKAEITTDSLNKIVLDSAVQFLKSHPYLKVAIYNFTDPRGNALHSIHLSQARAQAVTNLLLSAGIDSARIIAKGWEGTRPLKGYSANDIAKMKTMEEKDIAWQKDRRTELVILGTYYKK